MQQQQKKKEKNLNGEMERTGLSAFNRITIHNANKQERKKCIWPNYMHALQSFRHVPRV